MLTNFKDQKSLILKSHRCVLLSYRTNGIIASFSLVVVIHLILNITSLSSEKNASILYAELGF